MKNSRMTSSKKCIFAFFILFPVTFIECSQQQDPQKWPEILETAKKIYSVQNSRLGFMAPATRESLKELVNLYETFLKEGAAVHWKSLLPLVKDKLKVPLTDSNLDQIFPAYEGASKMTQLMSAHEHTCDTAIEFLTMKMGKYTDVLDIVWDRDISSGDSVPLKYDRDVYELLFIMHRVLLTVGNPIYTEYEEYNQRLETVAMKLVDDGKPDHTLDYLNSIAEKMGRKIAKIKQQDGLKRAKDILKKAEMDLGKNSEKTIAVAQIIASLYNHVGMTHEAREIQKRFNVDSKLTEQENFEEGKTEL